MTRMKRIMMAGKLWTLMIMLCATMTAAKLRRRCEDVVCPEELPVCEPDQVLVMIPGRRHCCPHCRNIRKPRVCRDVECDEFPTCLPGQEMDFTAEACCGVCIGEATIPDPLDDCATVDCDQGQDLLPCLPEEMIDPPEGGGCCPICPPPTDCSAVSCVLPPHCPFEELVTPEGECCPQCPEEWQDPCEYLDVECGPPECPEEEWYYPQGECCPDCLGFVDPCDPDEVECEPLDCPEHQWFFPDGECCPFCGEDCTIVRCGTPECPEEQWVMPPGGCCYECSECDPLLCPQDLPCAPEELSAPPGACCETCPPHYYCDEFFPCIEPECDEPDAMYTPEGSCCPVCECRDEFEYDYAAGTCVPITCEAADDVCPPGTVCIPQDIACIWSPCPQFFCELDCSLVDCADPVCDDPDVEPILPPGACCAVCPEDYCWDVACPLVAICQDGSLPEIPPGGCCPICPPIDDACAAVTCAVPPVYCDDLSLPYIPEGECCHVCPRFDCDELEGCAEIGIDCPNGGLPIVGPGACCPYTCSGPQVDCSLVLCAKPPELCDDGTEPVVPEGECCPGCEWIDCDELGGCPEILITCDDGLPAIVGPDSCCPFYCPGGDPCWPPPPCALPICPDGQEPVIPEGQCCPQCPDWDDPCWPPRPCPPPPECPDNEEPVIPEGQCCPQCPDWDDPCWPPRPCPPPPECPDNEEPVIPEGQCCLQCPDPE